MSSLIIPDHAHITTSSAPKTPLHVRVEKDAHYDLVIMVQAGERIEVDIDLAEPGATFECVGLMLLRGVEEASLTLRVRHSAPDTHSAQCVRAIVNNTAKASFAGTVIVERDAVGTNATQQCKSILLAPTAQMQTRPQMEIYADEVMCSHGATSGALDDEALFYLRTRGIDEHEATNLLLYGFMHSALEKIKDLDVHKDMIDTVNAWLMSS